MSTEEMYQRARNNSVGKSYISVRKAKKAVTKAFITGAIITILSGASFSLGVNAIKDKIEVENSIMPYHEMVDENTHRTQSGEDVWYDNSAIASNLKEDGKISDLEIYKTYKAMEFNKTSNMSEVLQDLDYSSFDDYVKGLGFKDIKEYDNFMKEKLLLQNKLDEMGTESGDLNHGM